MMRYSILIIGVFLVFGHATFTNTLSLPTPESEEIRILELTLRDYDSRFSLSSLWQNIKDTLKNAWENIKTAAKKTVENIKIWIYNLHLKAEELLERVKEKLNELKEEIQNKMAEIAKQSEKMAKIVKKCYQENEQDIEDIVKESLNQIRKCVFDNSKAIEDLERSISNPINETKFIVYIRHRLDSCTSYDHDVDKCLLNVKNDVYFEITGTDLQISKTENNAKSFIDDILEKLLLCATDGILKASEKLSDKVIDIGKCIKNEVKNEEYNAQILLE